MPRYCVIEYEETQEVTKLETTKVKGLNSEEFVVGAIGKHVYQKKEYTVKIMFLADNPSDAEDLVRELTSTGGAKRKDSTDDVASVGEGSNHGFVAQCDNGRPRQKDPILTFPSGLSILSMEAPAQRGARSSMVSPDLNNLNSIRDLSSAIGSALAVANDEVLKTPERRLPLTMTPRSKGKKTPSRTPRQRPFHGMTDNNITTRLLTNILEEIRIQNRVINDHHQKEIDLLKKQNDLLQKQNDSLQKQNENLMEILNEVGHISAIADGKLLTVAPNAEISSHSSSTNSSFSAGLENDPVYEPSVDPRLEAAFPDVKGLRFQEYLTAVQINRLNLQASTRPIFLRALLSAIFDNNTMATSTISGQNEWKKLDERKVSWAKKVIFILKPLTAQDGTYKVAWNKAASNSDQTTRNNRNKAKKRENGAQHQHNGAEQTGQESNDEGEQQDHY